MRFLQYSIWGLWLSTSAGASADDRTVDAATDALVGLLLDADAVEYREARRFHYLKDKRNMALAFFTIEGFNAGNNFTFYLAVFEPSRKYDPSTAETAQHDAADIAKYRLVGYAPVGGKGWRFVDFVQFTVEGKQITLHTKEYAGNDPMCCPSKTATAVYRIEDTQLIELQPSHSP